MGKMRCFLVCTKRSWSWSLFLCSPQILLGCSYLCRALGVLVRLCELIFNLVLLSDVIFAMSWCDGAVLLRSRYNYFEYSEYLMECTQNNDVRLGGLIPGNWLLMDHDVSFIRRPLRVSRSKHCLPPTTTNGVQQRDRR